MEILAPLLLLTLIVLINASLLTLFKRVTFDKIDAEARKEAERKQRIQDLTGRKQ